jgi:alkanesulfonate monooxygenase SsuD/methylene tetrahydromethanopterin reductase-like flavin-dependent oxidoreductase (luciferase family)
VRFGALGRGLTLDEIAGHALADRAAGYSSIWFSDGIGMDPLTLIAALGLKVAEVELGTAVVRTLPRHPMILAQQALTANALTGGRLTLGIGPSHRPIVEAGWGLPFDNPPRQILCKNRPYMSWFCTQSRRSSGPGRAGRPRRLTSRGRR